MGEITFEEMTRLADLLSPGEQRRLIDHLARQVGAGDQAALATATNSLERPPRSLYGIWAGLVPEDFDIDAALHEIRHEWEKELSEFFDP